MIAGIQKEPVDSLSASNAVAALIQLEDERYLMQHRDNVPHIWYPGYWGCFGGAVDEGEDPLEALKRELYEELSFSITKAIYFTRFDFDLRKIGKGTYYRIYYVVPMSQREQERIVLHEGQGVKAFSGEELLSEIRLAPYDAFALFLYHNRKNIL
ncbi:MAG: NUDIX domain-containing protein [Nitrospirota bacterium]